MSDTELKTLADLLEKLARKERLTESERLAAIKVANAADLLASEKRNGR